MNKIVYHLGGLLAIASLYVACSTPPAAKEETSWLPLPPPIKTHIGIAVSDTPPPAETAEEWSAFYYCSSPISDPRDLAAQRLIGKTVPDLEDSTLITLVYGSPDSVDDHLAFNLRQQMWDEEESVLMAVEERLVEDSLQIVYLRGEDAITMRMHDHYVETALLMRQTADGWKVLDAYVDAETIDFAGVEIVGHFHGRMILKYMTSGIYAGGVSFSSDEYTLLAPGRLRGQAIPFIMGRSNGASDQCYNPDDIPDYHCDCYNGDGKVDFVIDSILDCIVFHYTLDNEKGDCDMKGSKIEHAQQTWYMNTDTAFQGKGHVLSEWGEGIEGKIKMTTTEIRTALRGGVSR